MTHPHDPSGDRPGEPAGGPPGEADADPRWPGDARGADAPLPPWATSPLPPAAPPAAPDGPPPSPALPPWQSHAGSEQAEPWAATQPPAPAEGAPTAGAPDGPAPRDPGSHDGTPRDAAPQDPAPRDPAPRDPYDDEPTAASTPPAAAADDYSWLTRDTSAAPMLKADWDFSRRTEASGAPAYSSDAPAEPDPSEAAAMPTNPRNAGAHRAPRAARALPAELSPRPSRHRGRKVLARGTALLSVLILLVSVAGYAAFRHYERAIAGVGIEHDKGVPDDGKGETFLLVGSDSRGTLTAAQRKLFHTGRDVGRRSDTMIMVHISGDKKNTTMVSLPRDTYITIPAHKSDSGQQVPETHNKLNAAYAFGGPTLTVQTIERATGVHIDHYVEVDFLGFVNIVDAVGGVDVCVPRPVHDEKANLTLPAGTSHVDGVRGLAYVRSRSISADADLGRIKRQQSFMGSTIKQATKASNLLNPLHLRNLLDAVTSSIRTDPDLKAKDLLTLATKLRSLDPKRVTFVTVPLRQVNGYVPNVGSVVLWDDRAAADVFTALKRDQPLNDPRDDPKLARGQVSVDVRNGTATPGKGTAAAQQVEAGGFHLAKPASNADKSTYKTTTIRYSGSDTAAKKLASALKKDPVFEKVDGLPANSVQLIVAGDFAGVKAPAPAVKTAADNPCT